MATKTFLTTTPTGLKYNWSTGGNWNPSGSPTTNDSVTMASGGGNQGTYTAFDDILNLALNDLTIQDSGVTLEVGSGNSLTVQTNLSNAGQISVFGTFTVQNINSNSGSITAESGGQIFLQNVAAGNYFVETGGQITISASGNINGNPTFFIQGGLLTGLNNTAGQANADFAGNDAGHLAINTTLNSNPYNNSVLNMGLGDTIEFNDVNITSLNFVSATNTLTLNWSGGSRDVHITSFQTGLANPDFILSTDPVTGQAAAEVVCFLRGTRIRTPGGTRPVELLLVGDKVLTADGQARAVRWIWRQTVVSRFADELRAYPIRITAGALDENLPERDLFVSPDHAILVDGCLVHAGALVNNTTIFRVRNPERKFVYYHVELEDHALIVAEGVAAETFVDNITRCNFDNYADYEAFYGSGEVPIVEMEWPRAKSARQLPRVIRDRLAARVAALAADMREAA